MTRLHAQEIVASNIRFAARKALLVSQAAESIGDIKLASKYRQVWARKMIMLKRLATMN